MRRSDRENEENKIKRKIISLCSTSIQIDNLFLLLLRESYLDVLKMLEIDSVADRKQKNTLCKTISPKDILKWKK